MSDRQILTQEELFDNLVALSALNLFEVDKKYPGVYLEMTIKFKDENIKHINCLMYSDKENLEVYIIPIGYKSEGDLDISKLVSEAIAVDPFNMEHLFVLDNIVTSLSAFMNDVDSLEEVRLGVLAVLETVQTILIANKNITSLLSDIESN